MISQSLDLLAPKDLRRAIGAIMAKGVLPETSRTGNAVTTKWRRLINNPEELVENKGKVLCCAVYINCISYCKFC